MSFQHPNSPLFSVRGEEMQRIIVPQDENYLIIKHKGEETSEAIEINLKKRLVKTYDSESWVLLPMNAEQQFDERARLISHIDQLRLTKIHDIRISAKDLREWLEGRLERKPTDDEVADFIGFIERDVPQFLTDNAKEFSRECLPI